MNLYWELVLYFFVCAVAGLLGGGILLGSFTMNQDAVGVFFTLSQIDRFYFMLAAGIVALLTAAWVLKR